MRSESRSNVEPQRRRAFDQRKGGNDVRSISTGNNAAQLWQGHGQLCLARRSHPSARSGAIGFGQGDAAACLGARARGGVFEHIGRADGGRSSVLSNGYWGGGTRYGDDTNGRACLCHHGIARRCYRARNGGAGRAAGLVATRNPDL